MESLLEKYEGDRWYPQKVDIYRNNIKMDMSIQDAKITKSNVAYNLQYLEFIEKEIDELHLQIVVSKMLYKTYIIVSMGIIESLFANLLKSKGIWKVSEWKSVETLVSNEKVVDNKHIKVKTEIYEKVEKFEESMDLDSMIKKIEKKSLLNINHRVFPALKMLRELRNKVHLQNRNDFEESDFNSFQLDYKKMMGRVLYTILTLDEFSVDKDTKIYDFLKRNFPKEK